MKVTGRRATKTRKVPPGRRQEQAREKATRPESSFPIVGIGASAGGLDAFERLLKQLPANTGMAFVFVTHLDPTYKSRLTEILSQSTPMTVAEATEGMPIEPNRIYVSPPGAALFIKNGLLHLESGQPSKERCTSIDSFFRSLATEQKNRAIGVILSGTASDGTAGMKAIKAEGGVTFAQDSASAKYDGMPQSSITAGSVDFVLSPEKIAEHLARLRNHPYVQPLRPPSEEARAENKAQSSVQELFRMLKESFRVDFSAYKFSTIDRRIKRRMALRTIDKLEAYVRRVRDDPAELRGLFQDMFIGVTEFFREPGMFKALAGTVYPAIVKNRPSGPPIRIWVPGCSTGEEVYSIAISLLEFMFNRANNTPIQIFGTDVNEEAIKKARLGNYGSDITANVSSGRLQRFFTKSDSGFCINKAVRDVCTFAQHDIVQDPPFVHLDLLCCRNLLIYLSSASQEKLIPKFHYSLNPDGLLLLGPAETIGGFAELFALRDRKYRFYTKKTTLHRPHFEMIVERVPNAIAVEARTRPAIAQNDLELHKETVDHLILNHYGPPAVLVNENMEILHFRGHTGPYLEHASGAASLNLIKMAREGLLRGLRASMNAARKKNAPVRKQGLWVEFDGQEKVIDIEVVPIKAPGSKDRTFLVLFGDVTPSTKAAERGAGSRAKVTRAIDDIRVAQLKEELAATKAYLQSVVESQEASNEELRSLNEEIRSANEELQSTTEELETANEEMQSSNEELNTLNEELRHVNLDLGEANNDISNLLASMHLSVLILGRDMRVRRFTPTAQKVLNLVSTDVGRLLHEIGLPLAIQGLEQRIRDAMENLTTWQADVQIGNGHLYALQVRPYVTAEKQIEAVVIALTDISEEQERFQVIADLLPAPVAYVRSDLHYQFGNAAFEEWYGLTRKQIRGRLIREVLGDVIYDTFRPYVEKALAGQRASYEEYLSYQKAGRRYVRMDFVPRKDENGLVIGYYAVLRDLTQLKDSEEKYRAFLEAAPEAMIIHDPDGKIVVTNVQAERMFGYSKQELIGQPFEMLMAERFRQTYVNDRIAFIEKPVSGPMGTGLELYGRSQDGFEFPVEIHWSPVETSKGILVSSAIRDVTERKQLAEQIRWSAALKERGRVARDVHDTLAQGFTGIILNLEMAEESCANLPEEVRNRLARAREVARSSLEEARRSVLSLSTSPPLSDDLPTALRALVDRYQSSTKTRLELSIQGTALRRDPAIEDTLRHMVQQATDNALLHAHADSIRIELDFGKKQIQLKITDDGRGFEVEAGRGFGLASMRERAKEIGGTFNVKSEPGKGTCVEVQVPYLRRLAASR